MSFFIDGTLWSSALLDYEAKNTYNLTIEASDLGKPIRSSTVEVFISVTDMPDTSPSTTEEPRGSVPTFPHPLYNISISPFTHVGVVVLNVTAGNGDITYSINGRKC